MTLTRAQDPEPTSPKTSDRVAPTKEPGIPGFPEVLDALSRRWSHTSSLPTSALPSTEADDAAKSQAWDMVDEWGLQSFPASDPPSNW